MLAAYAIPKGVAMYKLNPQSGFSTAPFATEKYLGIMNQDRDLFPQNGVAAVTQHMHDTDRELCDMYVIDASERALDGDHTDCIIANRISRGDDGHYSWMRQWTLPGVLPEEGLISCACLIESFDEGADKLNETLNEERSERIIAAMANRLFDCCLWTDERMRIVNDNVECRKRVYGDVNRSLRKNICQVPERKYQENCSSSETQNEFEKPNAGPSRSSSLPHGE